MKSFGPFITRGCTVCRPQHSSFLTLQPAKKIVQFFVYITLYNIIVKWYIITIKTVPICNVPLVEKYIYIAIYKTKRKPIRKL